MLCCYTTIVVEEFEVCKIPPKTPSATSLGQTKSRLYQPLSAHDWRDELQLRMHGVMVARGLIYIYMQVPQAVPEGIYAGHGLNIDRSILVHSKCCTQSNDGCSSKAPLI